MSVFYTGRSPDAESPARLWVNFTKTLHRTKERLGKNPKLRYWGQLLLAGAVAFALSPCAAKSLPLPVLAGFLFALKADWKALFAAVMGCLGGIIFWDGDILAGLLAESLGALVTVAALSGSAAWKKAWVQGLLCALVVGAVGLFPFLRRGSLEGVDLLSLGIRVGFAVLSQRVWTLGLYGRVALALDGAVGLVTMGLCQIVVLGAVDLGFVLGATVACCGWGLPMALFCGLGMDLSGVTVVPMTAILCLSAMGKKVLPSRRGGFLSPAVLSLIWGAAGGSLDMGLAGSLLLGGAASLLFGRKTASESKPVQTAEARLMAASSVLGHLAGLLLPENGYPSQEALIQEAARAACGSCPRSCASGEDGEACPVPEQILPGLLAGEELSESLLEGCSRSGEFARELGCRLGGVRLRKQYYSRLTENRKALARQYEILSRFLLEMAMPTRSEAPCAYQAEVGCSTTAALGKGRSGDRVAWFSAPQNRFYVVLCDGMGTGQKAAKAGQQALELLRGLLRAGMEPESALATLNDYYVLKEVGGLSTADLLELRLDTGRAILYKWGGAPSYLKHRQSVRKIGTAAPPPGVGIGDDHGPEVIRLSMQRGQTLVLVSDGLAGEELPKRIAGCSDAVPQAMAESLTLRGRTSAEDDCTAVAVCLNPLGTGIL